MQKQNLKLKIFFLNILTFLFLSKVSAQTSTNAAGGDAVDFLRKGRAEPS